MSVARWVTVVGGGLVTSVLDPWDAPSPDSRYCFRWSVLCSWPLSLEDPDTIGYVEESHLIFFYGRNPITSESAVSYPPYHVWTKIRGRTGESVYENTSLVRRGYMALFLIVIKLIIVVFNLIQPLINSYDLFHWLITPLLPVTDRKYLKREVTVCLSFRPGSGLLRQRVRLGPESDSCFTRCCRPDLPFRTHYSETLLKNRLWLVPLIRGWRT